VSTVDLVFGLLSKDLSTILGYIAPMIDWMIVMMMY
jgi:hypothetical protein